MWFSLNVCPAVKSYISLLNSCKYIIIPSISIWTKANCQLWDRNPNTYNLILKRCQNDLDLEMTLTFDHIKTMQQKNLGFNSQNDQFYLDPVTLVLKLELDMVKMYHHTKNEVSMSRHSKVIACTDTQTDTQTV